MTETIIITPPRKRTKYIMVDLSNPDEYFIEITRENVKEISGTEEIFDRSDSKIIREKITFGSDGSPIGRQEILNLMPLIQQAIETIDA